jgi:hypothetical protein
LNEPQKGTNTLTYLAEALMIKNVNIEHEPNAPAYLDGVLMKNVK